MMHSNSPPRYGCRALAFGIAATVVYAVMITLSLSHLEHLAGSRPFDLRPMGYSVEQARSHLDALGNSGRWYYLTRQIPLDLLYPGLLAMTCISFLKWSECHAWVLKFGAMFCLGAATADYSENAGIAAMLLWGSDAPAVLISGTSIATVAKSMFTTVALLLVLIAALVRGARFAQASFS